MNNGKNHSSVWDGNCKVKDEPPEQDNLQSRLCDIFADLGCL